MNRLEDTFGEQIEFVLVDYDDGSQDEVRTKYGITGRTQYVLVGGDDEVLARWFGPITFDTIAAVLEETIN